MTVFFRFLLTGALLGTLTAASAQSSTTKKPAARPAAKPAAKPATTTAKPATVTTPPPAKPAEAHSEAGPAPAPKGKYVNGKFIEDKPSGSGGGGSSSNSFGLKGDNATFGKGTTALNLGIGLIGFGSYYTSGASVTPLLNLSVEHGIVDNVGPGIISVGGNFGFRRATYDYGNFLGTDYKWSWTDIYIGIRGAYHYNITGNPKVDTYAGLGLGARIWKWNDGGFYDGSYTSSGTSVVSGLFAGARYYFTDNIGAFAEFGYDIALLKIGLSAKF